MLNRLDFYHDHDKKPGKGFSIIQISLWWGKDKLEVVATGGSNQLGSYNVILGWERYQIWSHCSGIGKEKGDLRNI